MILLAMTVALAAAAVGSMAAALRRGEPACADRCGERAIELPAGSRLGATKPVVTIGLFVDLGSAASRQVFQHVTRSIHGLALETPVELRLLQLPSRGCAEDASAEGCVGARAVACAERLAGRGVLAAGAVFDLQWMAASQRTSAVVLAAVAGVGVDAAALGGCVEGDVGIDEQLAAHAAAAVRYGLAAAPGGVVMMSGAPERSAGFGAWVTERTLGDIVRCLAHGRCEASS